MANEDFEGAGGPEIITLDDEDESPDGQSGEEDVKDLALLPSHLVIDQDWSEEDYLVFEAFSLYFLLEPSPDLTGNPLHLIFEELSLKRVEEVANKTPDFPEHLLKGNINLVTILLICLKQN